MAKVVIYNASILTLDDHDNFHFPGVVETEGDVITKVYSGKPSDELLNDPSVPLLDGTDRLVMPGFVDLHFHTSVAKVREAVHIGYC
jgi:5-methylthioadenosine/S-adenosylhomocysteine deaminase